MNDLADFFSHNQLFKGLDAAHLKQLANLTIQKEYQAGEIILEEGATPDFFYIIKEGEAEVLKKEPNTGKVFSVSTIHEGESIGEVALIDEGTRSATVQAKKKSKLLLLPLSEMKKYPPIISNLANILTTRLRHANETTTKSLQKQLDIATTQAEMGRFLFSIFIILTVWTFIVTKIRNYIDMFGHSTPFTIAVMLIIFVDCLHIVLKSSYPLSFYGVTLKNWKKNTFEAILFSIPILILGTLLKWYLVTYTEAFQGMTIFNRDFINPESPLPWKLSLILILAYLVFTPIQEFIVRGTTQTVIAFSLHVKHKDFWAIILSNLAFAAYHMHLSMTFSLVAFFVGLFWGWMFYRQKSLVGPSISHAIIGIYALMVLGLNQILI